MAGSWSRVTVYTACSVIGEHPGTYTDFTVFPLDDPGKRAESREWEGEEYPGTGLLEGHYPLEHTSW